MVAGMLMPLRDLRAIYEVLFRDGVMVAKKDKRPQIKHPDVESVSNLQVIRAMVSLKSRGYVKETFAWRHFYWYLSNEGIVYLRDYLRLPPEIVPMSLQRVRKSTTTLSVAQRAARVQSVEGPTSYVPKPGRRGEAESHDALAERQDYRHRMMGPGEKESYSDRTPRFRGRPVAAESVRPKASLEGEDQPLFRKGSSFRGEAVMVEESRVKRVSHQQPDVRSERPITTSQERRAFGVQKEKAPGSVPVHTAALKHDVSQTTLTSVSSKAALPLSVSAVPEGTSKIPSEPFTPKTNKEKTKISGEKTPMKSNEMIPSHSSAGTRPDTEVKEEKINKLIVDTIKPAEVKAEVASEKPQEVITVAAVQETSSLLIETCTAAPVSTKPANKGVKDEKTEKVIVHQVKSAEVKTTIDTSTDKVKPQTVTTKASAQETIKPLTATTTTTSVITKPANKDVKEEKAQKANVKEESIKPAELKTLTIDHEKAKKTSSVTVSLETSEPPPDRTTSEPVLSTDAPQEIVKFIVTQEPIDATLTLVNLSATPGADVVPLKTTTVTSILEVTTTVSTTTLSVPLSNAEDVQPVKGEATVTEVVTKEEKTDVKVVPYAMKGETIVIEEVSKVSVQDPTLAQKDFKFSQNVDATGGVKETKQVVEGSSKSKRKKKKSPGEISKNVNFEEMQDPNVEKEKTSKDKPLLEPAESTPPPTQSPMITLGHVCNGVQTKEASPVEKNEAEVKINVEREQTKDIPTKADGKPKEEVPKQTETISEASLPVGHIPTVPPVELPGEAQMKENKAGSTVTKITQGPLLSKGELNSKLLHMEPEKSEEISVNKVETETVLKITQVELIQERSRPETKTSELQSESHRPIAETKSSVSTEKAAEESSKGKKKGKGKKQAKTPDAKTINTKPVFLPEAEALPSTDITSLPKATVKDSPVMAPAPTDTNVSTKMTPKRMCSEEVGQAAAVLSEAPADKGEVEPTLLFAEKIKREVPKPKTSSTPREAPAAGELASAAPAEAAVAQAQASPLVKQEEPPRVAQHLATQTAERSTEKTLSVSEALKQKEEKKRDLKEDTPSATATPAAANPVQPHLGDTCESVSPDTDEAAMRKKIVVVEEIVEVKKVVNPQATGGQSPPPVQHEQLEQAEQPEAEGEELDVLEALAIERALLSGAAEARVQGASPEAEWDHSLEDPEEKSWPNFIEG